jgi:hypothetical protein
MYLSNEVYGVARAVAEIEEEIRALEPDDQPRR